MMENPLRPLTPEEQAIFEARRESGAVVQMKCSGCGAWSDTPKLATAYQETFDCDCGTRLTYPVPALEVDKLALASPTLDLSDPDARLDTGMLVREAIARASAWWDAAGRKEMAAAVKEGGAVPQSGIVQGQPWDTLSKLEKLNVIKAWHHFFVRVPEVIGTPEHEHKIGRPN